MASSILSSSFSSFRVVNASIHVPKPPPRVSTSYSVPKRKVQIQEMMNGSMIDTLSPSHNDNNGITTQIYHDLYNNQNNNSNDTVKLYAILEEVADRIEMHSNIGQQRDNWNTLLLNSINLFTLSATAIAAVAAATTGDSDATALKLSSTLLFSAATGMSLIMNKIQPSQLAEEQRNATRLFKNLHSQIQTTIALGNATEEDVRTSMEKVLALDKAYPLPLLGAMLEKFPQKYEPAVWWPSRKSRSKEGKSERKVNKNGWSEELETELREVIEVVKRKDIEDYERLGNIALKVNKSLAIAGPLLSGIAAVASSFVGNGSGSVVAMMAGSLASVVNALEHGGQVGMVFEMYRNCGGFFKLLEETIEGTLEEKDFEKRENGELFEMKVAIKLGRSVSQLRRLASQSSSLRLQGIPIDQFASKLF